MYIARIVSISYNYASFLYNSQFVHYIRHLDQSVSKAMLFCGCDSRSLTLGETVARLNLPSPWPPSRYTPVSQLESDAAFMDKYSRQIGAFGLEAMSKLMNLKVLIVGLRCVVYRGEVGAQLEAVTIRLWRCQLVVKCRDMAHFGQNILPVHLSQRIRLGEPNSILVSNFYINQNHIR